MLMATLLFGVALGFSLGYVTFSPRPPVAEEAKAQAPQSASEVPAAEPSPVPVKTAAPAAVSAPPIAAPIISAGAPQPGPAAASTPGPDGYWAARHLIIAVNGQWLAEGTKALLRELRPGAVLLQDVNLGSRTQTFALVKEIKAAEGLGEGLGDLPLIAVQQEGGPYNLLGVENAPSAQALGQNGDPELARKIGQQYGEACVGRGIAIAFAPVLDVFEAGAINPGFAVRSFGTEHTLVARIGLAMADGLRQGGVLPVVKHFPGYGAATYGSDGLLVALNKDPAGLGRLLYPFDQAVRRGVPGMLVAHVAVPALDPENPRRPAALSPVLVSELLRARWGYEGVIVADDVALNSMTRSMGAEQASVQALAAGCDAVIMLDPDPARIRAVSAAIAAAVERGTLSREKLQQSVARLQRWQEAIVNLNPIGPGAEGGRVAELAAPAHVLETAIAAPVEMPATQNPPTPAPAVQPAAPEVPAASPPIETAPAPAAVDSPSAEAATVPSVAEPVPATPEAAPLPVASPPPAEVMPVTNPAAAPAAAAAAAPADASRIEHTVREGEKLSDIARDYAVSVEDIVRWNELSSASPSVGAKLTIYLGDAGAPTKAPDAPSPPAAVAAEVPAAEAPQAEAPVPAPNLAGVAVKAAHTVVAGETLGQIAEKYKVAEADIKLWNGLETDALEAGAVLTIFLGGGATPEMEAKPEAAPEPAAETPSAPATTPEPSAAIPEPSTPASVAEAAPAPAAPTPPAAEIATEKYVVQAGDTINKIARQYKTTHETILHLNNLKDANQIRAGQTLKVPKPAP